MKSGQNGERNINMDIMRVAALFLVVSVHFFLWNGFYNMEMNSITAFVMCILRTMSMSCVPLFLLISGYLLSERDYIPVRSDYFRKLGYLLLVYVICTVILVFFRGVILHEEMNIVDIVINFISFSQYSWYVAMYAGLFVLIPYLNLFWKNMENDENGEKVFLAVLIVLAALPSVINIKSTIIPESWVGIYPITYYFIGAYIKRRQGKFNFSTRVMLPVWIILVLAAGGFNYLISNKKRFLMGAWNDWGSLQNIILSVLLFMIIYKIKTPDAPGKILSVTVRKISELSYIAFMLSYISDVVAWKIFKDIIPVENKLSVYVPAVLISFGMAVFMSWIVNTGLQIIGKMLKNSNDKNERNN